MDLSSKRPVFATTALPRSCRPGSRAGILPERPLPSWTSVLRVGCHCPGQAHVPAKWIRFADVALPAVAVEPGIVDPAVALDLGARPQPRQRIVTGAANAAIL